MFDTDDSNTCGDDYPGPSPDSAEVRAVMQFANEINSHKKEYDQVNYSPSIEQRVLTDANFHFSEFTSP